MKYLLRWSKFPVAVVHYGHERRGKKVELGRFMIDILILVCLGVLVLALAVGVLWLFFGALGLIIVFWLALWEDSGAGTKKSFYHCFR